MLLLDQFAVKHQNIDLVRETKFPKVFITVLSKYEPKCVNEDKSVKDRVEACLCFLSWNEGPWKILCPKQKCLMRLASSDV